MNLLPISFLRTKNVKKRSLKNLIQTMSLLENIILWVFTDSLLLKKQKKLNVEWATDNIVTLPSHPKLKNYELYI